MGSPVDWELAERIATRLTPRDPFAGVVPLRLADRRLRHGDGRGRRPRRGHDRAPVARWPGPGPARRPPAVGAGQRAGLPAAAPPRPRAARRPGGQPAHRCPSRSPGGSRRPRWGLCWPGCRAGCSGQYDLLVDRRRHRRRAGPRLLRRPERAEPGEALRLPAPGVPAVARPPRGHPPGPVHRRAVAARALPRPRRAGAEPRRHGPRRADGRAEARRRSRCAGATRPSSSVGWPPWSPPRSSARRSGRSLV